MGRTALVTGAAQGIGRAIARALSARGCAVGVADIDPAVEATARELQNGGGRSSWATFDVADRSAVVTGVDALRERLGAFDILVCNAAVTDQLHPALTFSPEGWERELSVNLSGAFWCVQAVGPRMREQRWGRIIVISSMAAALGLPAQVAYAASKAGLLGMIRTLTLELAAHGVTCNAILPGVIESEKVSRFPDKVKARALSAIPAARLGKMAEIAAVVTFLCSDEAGYVTGACLPVDGGLGRSSFAVGSGEKSGRTGAV
jgi:NAD(P)-dependent dehydrogenase (short-subunit alcohol dehydrogenase family)